MIPRPWERVLARRGYALVDGGLATELERRSRDLGTALWSAAVLTDDPAAISAVHDDYLKAGADIVISANYQASFEGFAATGIDHDRARALMQRAVDLALAACRHHGGTDQGPLAAASIGPYGAMLANGAEYTGDYGVGEGELVRFHRERLALLSASGADLLAIETIPSAAEAAVLAALVDETDGPAAWLSFSCRDGERLNDGSAIGAVVRELAAVPRIGAFGVNGTHPRFVESLVGEIRDAAPDADVVVYPNLGEAWNPRTRRFDPASGSEPFDALAERWYRAGARLIGGCCRTTPAHIAAVGRRLDHVVRQGG